MLNAFLRLSFPALVLLLIAGCGGGSGAGLGTTGGGGGNPTTVTIAFTGIGSTPLVAAKIGSGVFTAQTLNAGTLNLSIPSGTSNYAVAFLCPSQPLLSEEIVWEASIADGTSISLGCPSEPGQTGTLGVSLDASAIPGVVHFDIDAQNSNASLWEGASGPIANVSFPEPAGNDRVLVLAFNGLIPWSPVAAKNFDNQTVPGNLNGGNTVVFGAADKTRSEAITYNNVPSGFSIPSTYITLEMGGVGGVPFASGVTTQYSALPAGAQESGDSYLFEASSYAGSGSSLGVFAGTKNSGGAVSFAFPAPWTYAGPTPAALPTFSFDYTGFSGKTGVQMQGLIYWPAFTPGGSTWTDEIEVAATPNYQNGSTTMTVPDLSGLTGFLPTPTSGTKVQWEAEVWQFGSGYQSEPSLNSTWAGVENSGGYTVP
jgi:hypothetical protein